MTYIEKEIEIGSILDLIEKGYEIEVDSPDGWVPVIDFVDKGMWEEYELLLQNGKKISCNEAHLFETETTLGWISAKELHYYTHIMDIYPHILVRGGVSKVIHCNPTGKMVPIVDITVDHENHRYYTDGVSSHNTGVGKSLAMCHFAAANLMDNRKVLYITMEMAEERIAERIDANLLDVPLKELEELPKASYMKKVDKVRDKTEGRLIIKEYPTATAGVGHFRHLLNELRLKRNFVPDIMYVDYLNICASMRLRYGANVNSYTYIKAIAEEMRGLAVEKNIPIVTATQTTRSGYTNSDPGLEDTSESFGLPATVDLMFALVTSEELENLNQIMVKQLKNRFNDPTDKKRFVVGVDRSKMRLYDVELSAQEEIIDDRPIMDNTDFGDRYENDFKKKFAALR